MLTRLHRQRERDRRLVEAKKKDALRKHGRLFCEACDLQPELKFGNRGRSVIECHHIRPLHTLVDGDTMRLDDLALICANCHRLIHGGKPWLTLEDLRLSLPGYEQRDDAGDANRVLAHSQHLLDALAVWFANWPVSAVPRSGALVYTVWNRSGQFVHVGMAGRGEPSTARGF